MIVNKFLLLFSASLCNVSFANNLSNKDRMEQTAFKIYDCSQISEEYKDVCWQDKKDSDTYNERKNNFKDNRVKYFFNPSSLVQGLKTPQSYNKIVDDVFKSLKKEKMSYANYKIAIKMKNKLKENFDKNVIKKFSIDPHKIYNRENDQFLNEYNQSYDNFYEKIKIFEKITQKYENIENFLNSYKNIDAHKYLFLENDMSEKQFIESVKKDARGNYMNCLYGSYEFIRLDIEEKMHCEDIKIE